MVIDMLIFKYIIAFFKDLALNLFDILANDGVDSAHNVRDLRNKTN